MKAKMKTKMNKKCARRSNDDVEGGQEDEKEIIKKDMSGMSSSGKKRGRGGGVMEGSRCSRVNGRGWRCCQQTLVGYSLCEHHLGKGRLRSMTSVRSRSLAATAPSDSVDVYDPKPPPPPLSTTSTSLSLHDTKPVMVSNELRKAAHEDENEEEEEEEEEKKKKPLMITKKRMKLGMVKARSISSLLGQIKQQCNFSR